MWTALIIPSARASLTRIPVYIVYRVAAGRRIELAAGPRAVIHEETYRRIVKTLRPSDE